MGKQWKQWETLFWGSKITAGGDCSHEIKRHLLLGRKAVINLDRILKSRDITLPTKVHLVKDVVFPVVMYGCESWTVKKAEHWKESWVPKNWCFWTVVLEETLESPLDCKEIQPIHLKGNQSWIFTGRNEVETPILWPPDAKNWLIGKGPDAWKNWRWEEKRMTQDEMMDGITDTMMNLSRLQGLLMNMEAWHAAIHGVTKCWHNWVSEPTERLTEHSVCF